uniref:UPF0481 protein At3g47200 family n=1 Tax=Cajanus cajan TaxID=3821 RepID=A0A151QZV1_CAJCA|nr:UPF0481 protein At3g47200 family [Cajanus cajan]
MISFGLIHHGSEIIKEGEHYKLLWTSEFVAKYNENLDSDEVTQVLLKGIEDNMEELKKEFADDVILEGKYNDNDLAWMLFVDGCSLLHFMENLDIECPETLNLMLHQLLQILRDAILLENQLPRRLLEMLSKEEGPKLEFLFFNLCVFGQLKQNGIIGVSIQNPKPIHILDFHRLLFLEELTLPIFYFNDNTLFIFRNLIAYEMCPNVLSKNEFCSFISFMDSLIDNAEDVKELRLSVIPNPSSKNSFLWNDINFTSKWFSGELRLPLFYYNEVTTYFFGNIIAYEMCRDVRCEYEFCSYISFMDSLIDNVKDVKELTLSGVVQNLLGSDQDLANLFNELGEDLPTKMYSGFSRTDSLAFNKKYILVKQQIEKHYTTKWRTWLAEAYNTYFNTPWAVIAFLAASLVLILTFIQTLFTIHS